MLSPSRTPQFDEAMKHHEMLQKELADCLDKFDFLRYHAKPFLEADYMQKIGKFKLELLQLETEAVVLKRKGELMQAAINKNESYSKATIDLLVEVELREHIATLEKEAKRMQDALLLKSNVLNEADNKRMKELYYKLVRNLHPDVNPVQTEETKSFWIRVQEAYKNGDLAAMEMMFFVSGQLTSQQENLSLLDDVLNSNSKLAQHIASVIHSTHQLKSAFPFTLELSLADEGWVNNEVSLILNNVQKAAENKTFYEALYNELAKFAS